MSSPSVLNDLEHLRHEIQRMIGDITEGRMSFVDALSIDDDRSYTYVVKALEAAPGIGKVKARRILDDVGVGEQVRIADLSSTQRRQVIDRASA